MKSSILYFALGIIVSCLYLNLIAHAEEIDYCNNIEGIQSSMPAGYSTVGSPGQCYLIPPPVTIDLNPPGNAPVTTDINPVDSHGNSGPAQTIDVNPGNGPQSVSAAATASDGTKVELSTTTPKLITSLEDLQPFIFDPSATKAEKIALIETRIKVLLQKLIDILVEELEALIAAQTATTTPPVI